MPEVTAVEMEARAEEHESLTPRSRSPTPPRYVEQLPGGTHRFTQEDERYLV